MLGWIQWDSRREPFLLSTSFFLMDAKHSRLLGCLKRRGCWSKMAKERDSTQKSVEGPREALHPRLLLQVDVCPSLCLAGFFKPCCPALPCPPPDDTIALPSQNVTLSRPVGAVAIASFGELSMVPLAFRTACLSFCSPTTF